AVWCQTLGELTEAATAEARAGRPPVGKKANRLIDRWLAMQAATVGKEADEAFAVELLKRVEEGADPRARRYWELVGLLRGCSTESPRAVAWDWLIEGLRRRLAQKAGC